MMLEYMGWQEAADLIIKGIEGAISQKRVTYDFHRLMEGATKLKCSEFGDEIIANMSWFILIIFPIFNQTAASMNAVLILLINSIK